MLRTALPGALVGVVALALSACGSSGSPSSADDAVIRPISAAGPHGRFSVRQEGTKLTASWDLTGLVPGAHASHIHGPNGACRPAAKRTAGMAVVLPDVRADASGRARGSATVTVHEAVVKPGFYVQVHRDGTPGRFSALTATGTEVQAGTMGAGAMGGLMKVMDKDPGVGCAGL